MIIPAIMVRKRENKQARCFLLITADSLIGGKNAQKPPGVEIDVLGKISTIQRCSFLFEKQYQKTCLCSTTKSYPRNQARFFMP
jgi:hypothetical protein